MVLRIQLVASFADGRGVALAAVLMFAMLISMQELTGINFHPCGGPLFHNQERELEAPKHRIFISRIVGASHPRMSNVLAISAINDTQVYDVMLVAMVSWVESHSTPKALGNVTEWRSTRS
jgi:hypothetical protein